MDAWAVDGDVEMQRDMHGDAGGESVWLGVGSIYLTGSGDVVQLGSEDEGV